MTFKALAATAPPKRLPQTPTAPITKTPCTIHPTAVISDKASITGAHAVTIGENVIIHPFAKINAEGGNVVIGKFSLVSERAVVGGGEGDVVLGEGVDVQSGAQVQAKEVGAWTTVEINAIVGKDAVLGSWCKIAALEEVRPREVLEDYTVVFADGQRRIAQTVREHQQVRGAKVEAREKEVELLRRLIENTAHKWT